jgi:hypothetical protein
MTVSGVVVASVYDANLTFNVPQVLAWTIEKECAIYRTSFGSVVFYFNYSSRIKIGLYGSVASTVAIPIKLKLSNSVVGDRSVFCKGVYGSVGFDWSDIKQPTSFLVDTLYVTVNGKFDIDPSLVASVGLATAMNQQHHNFHDGSYYWCYYQNGTGGSTWGQVLAEYSSDGVTWSNTPVNVLNYTPASAIYPFSLKYYLNATSGVKYVYCAYQKNLTNPSDEVYFRRDSISGTTITLGTEYALGNYLGTVCRYSCPEVELNTQGIVFVSYGRLDTSSLKSGYLKIGRNTNPDGSGSWLIASWTLWYWSTATEMVVSSMTRLANSTGFMYCLFTGYETNANLWCVVWTGSGFSLAKETVRSLVSTMWFFDTSYYGQNVLFAFVDGGTPYLQPHFTYRNESGYWQTEEGFPNRFTQAVTMTVNASNGDCWFFYEGNETNHVFMIKRSWDGSYSSEVDLFSASDISEPSIIAMVNPNGQYLGLQYNSGIPCSSLDFYVYDTVVVSKAWNTVSTWTFQLLTRQWNTVGTWGYQLLTRQWINISTWSFQLVTRAWNTVGTWTHQLLTRQWNIVETWTLQFLTRQWTTVETWLFQLSPEKGWRLVSTWFFVIGGASNVPVLFIGLAFFGSLALGVFGWRLKKRRL